VHHLVKELINVLYVGIGGIGIAAVGKRAIGTVTGQLADTPTHGLPTRGLDDSRTGHLADWSTRGLDNSRTGQVADAIGDFACLVFLFGSICETASCPVRDLSSPRVDQPTRCPVRELACPRVVQLPSEQRLLE